MKCAYFFTDPKTWDDIRESGGNQASEQKEKDIGSGQSY